MLLRIVLASSLVGVVNCSCNTLRTDIADCFPLNAPKYNTYGTDSFTIYQNFCRKKDDVLDCWFNALESCAEHGSYIQFPDTTAMGAAYGGVCANKAVFDAGLTCMQNSGVNAATLENNCTSSSGLANAKTQFAQSNYQPYCRAYVSLIDCYKDGYSCSSEFETMYKYYFLALLPEACRSNMSYTSPWIAAYGSATVQNYSYVLLMAISAARMLIMRLF